MLRRERGFLTAFHSVLLTLALLTPAALQAEKSADKKSAEDEKEARPELGGAGEQDQQAKVIDEGKKNLEEIRDMLEKIQNDLADKQTGSSTQSQQKQVVQRMSELIDKLAEECNRCQGGGQGEGQKKDPQQKSQGKGQKKGSKQSRQQRENQKQVSSSQREQERLQREQQEQSQKEGEKQGQQNEKEGSTRNDQVADGPRPDAESGNLADSIRKSGRWGVLPPKIRDAIFSTADKKSPTEYRRIIEKYYERISNQYGR